MQRFTIAALAALLAGLMSATALAQDTTAPVVGAPDVRVAVPADVTDAEHNKIMLLLSGHDYFPTHSDLLAATPKARAILFAIATDANALPSHRIRAIDALGLFPEDDSLAQFLEQALNQTDLRPTFARHYINTSLKVFHEQAVPWVAPHLNNPDLQTQLTVIHSLGLFGGNSGREVLRFHRQFIHRDVLIEDTLERALAR
ncbi:MAG: hypothetical protein AAFS10_23755 [Myxococcota bacterium]